MFVFRRRTRKSSSNRAMSGYFSLFFKFYIHNSNLQVGVELVTDPAFLVTRAQSVTFFKVLTIYLICFLQDLVAWARESKLRKHVDQYNNERDDFDE
jgi:U3 small nucleolar ribonucleoprotein protein IMP3